MTWLEVLAAAAIAVGLLVCCVNFFLSFARVPLLRAIRPGADVRLVSGIPLLGSGFVGLGSLAFLDSPVALSLLLAAAVLDTGGVLWFVGVLLVRRRYLRRRG